MTNVVLMIDRGLSMGEVGEVISTLYDGEYRVKAPNGDISYYKPNEIDFFEEGPNKPYRNARARSFNNDPRAIARNRSASCVLQ